MTSQPLRRLTWVLAILLVAGLVAWGSYSITANVRQANCASHLKQIGFALHNYEDRYHSFPPAYVLGPDGRPWHSWRVLLLPYVGQQQLYEEYKFDEPWDSDHNRQLIERMPEIYGCISGGGPPGRTSYLAIVGEQTVWPGHKSVKVTDIRDGTSNTLQLMEVADSDVPWTEPRDLSVEKAWEVFQTPGPHNPSGKPGCNCLLCNGSERHIATQSLNDPKSIFTLLVCCGSRKSLGPHDQLPEWLVGKREPELGDFAPSREPQQLAATRVLGTPRMDLNPGESQVWCATFQMARDLLRDNYGGSAIDPKNRVELAASLNAERFPPAALASECRLLDASPPGPAEDERLRKLFAARFPAAPVHIADSESRPEAVRIYAYLQKVLPFVDDLERLHTPLHFRAGASPADVNSFGAEPNPRATGVGSPVRQDQVAIRDYVSDDDFIVELFTRSEQRDHVVLARVPPETSLAATWKKVLARLQEPHKRHDRPHLMSVDRLAVPILSFNLWREYDELLGRATAGEVLLQIDVARQEIRFRLDEQGATLISLAEIEALAIGDDEPPPRRPRLFLFDAPFLIALREDASQPPYFLAWIGNADLMESFTPTKAKELR